MSCAAMNMGIRIPFQNPFWGLHEIMEKDLALFLTFSRHSINSISFPSPTPLSSVSVLALNPDEVFDHDTVSMLWCSECTGWNKSLRMWDSGGHSREAAPASPSVREAGRLQDSEGHSAFSLFSSKAHSWPSILSLGPHWHKLLCRPCPSWTTTESGGV